MTELGGSKGKIAWCLSPVWSGVTTVYKVVGAGLRRAGWEVTGFVSGTGEPGEADGKFADEFCKVLVPGDSDVCRNAGEFVRRVVDGRIDVVFCTGAMFTLAATPALPPYVRLITRCGAMTRRGYELATANLSRIDKIVVETPRQEKDLIRSWGVPPEKCKIIPGGVEVETYSRGAIRDFKEILRLIYLGRLDDASKGVLLLPRMASRLAEAGVEFHLDIIGDGPDGERLKNVFTRAKLDTRVTFHGSLAQQETAPFLQRAHVVLLPSRYEGVPWALLETMACGCVPVASRIGGATDYVVAHGINGLLCTVGMAPDFAKAIMALAVDRNRLKLLSNAASQTIRERFRVERVVKDHDDLLTTLLAEEPVVRTPIPVSAIQVPNLSGSNWRRFVPQGMKNYLRTWAERFHRSV